MTSILKPLRSQVASQKGRWDSLLSRPALKATDFQSLTENSADVILRIRRSHESQLCFAIVSPKVLGWQAEELLGQASNGHFLTRRSAYHRGCSL